MSLLVNFVHQQLGCTVYCDSPSFSDDYALNNLISDNPIIRSKGFLAAQFTKPPLDILISLPYPIEVERIGILAKTGTCISQSISIYVSDQSMDDLIKNTNHLMNLQSRNRNVAMLDVATPHHLMAPRGKNNDLSKERYPGDLMMSGGTLYNQSPSSSSSSYNASPNALYSQLLFRNFTLMSTMENLQQLGSLYSYKCNTHFDYRKQPGDNSSFYPLPQQLNDQIKQINQLQSFHSNINLLNNVKTIRLRILNVFQSSCPALGGVEIWGFPSRSLAPDIVNQIYNSYSIIVQQQNQIKQQQQQLQLQQQQQTFSFNNLLNSSICISSPLPSHLDSNIKTPTFSIPIPTSTTTTATSTITSTSSISTSTSSNHVNFQQSTSGNSTSFSFSLGTNNNSHGQHHSHSNTHSHHGHHHHHHHQHHTTPNNTPRRAISSSMEMESDTASTVSSNNNDFEQFLASHPEIILDEAGVPTIFIDPITTKMMEDPVVLPSGKTVDRTTMEKLFQNQYYTDPFSGVRITFADIKADNVLKLQIQSFINEKKKRKRMIKNKLPTLVSSSSSIDPFASNNANANTYSSSSVASNSTCSSLNSSLSGTNTMFSIGSSLDNFLTDHQAIVGTINSTTIPNDYVNVDTNNSVNNNNNHHQRMNSGSINPLSRLLSQTSLSELPVKKIKK